ncbi:MAG: putative porin [Methylacidiphilales bacterium]|nr:putative porin [Candidatus Methylacidiphilales bacterium]
MKTMTKRVFAITGALALGLTALKAQTDSALLDALVKKGVLTEKEADDIRANEAKDYATTPAAKLGISNSVTKLTLYGDVRYRYEYADEKAQSTTNNPSAGTTNAAGNNIVERSRYRLRVGVDFNFTDNFTAGFELETGTANDSANQTFGSAYEKAAINVGLAYLQWKPVDWLTLTGGKQRNPLYTTDLVWDPDINPEGASEVMTWTFPLGGEAAPVGDPKEVGSLSTGSSSDESLTIGLTALQGIYAENSGFNSPHVAGQNNQNVWQFVEQVPVQFNFDKSTFVKIVPGFDTYTSGGNNGPGNGPTPEAGGGTQAFMADNAADDLAIITAPGEFDWKAFNQPFKFYWDFAANLNGKARVQDVYLVVTPGLTPNAATFHTQNQNRDLADNIAWLAGLQVGQNKKKGDWSIKADYRVVGLGSVDPNLNDSDWADSFLNQQGVKVQSTYNFTDFLTGTITVYDTWDYKSNLFSGQNTSQLQVGNPTNVSGTTAGLIGLAAASQVQRVDVDLQWKF